MPKTCPYCSANMGAKAIYCPRCGKKQPRLSQQDTGRLRKENTQPATRNPIEAEPTTDASNGSFGMHPEATMLTGDSGHGKRRAAATQLQKDEAKYTWQGNTPRKKPAQARKASPTKKKPRKQQATYRQGGAHPHDAGLQPLPSGWQGGASHKGFDKRLLFLLLIPIVLLGVWGLSQAASGNEPEPTQLAQAPTPTPTATPTPTPEPTPSPTPTPTPVPQLDELLQGQMARTYSSFTINDDRAGGIPAFTTLLPNGWTGGGNIIWDFHSTDSPGRYVFFATSPDGKAGLTLSSNLNFAHINSYDVFGEQATVPGLQDQPLLSPTELAMNYIPMFNGNLSQVAVTGRVDAESGDAQANYISSMDAVFNALRNSGLTVKEPYVAACQMEGTLIFNGQSCDMVSDIIRSGYKCSKSDIFSSTEVDYWNLEYMCTYYAPQDMLDAYMADMQLIMDNFHINDKWLRVKKDVSSQMNASIGQQQYDWDMNAYGEQALAIVGAQADRNTSYQKISILDKIDFYAAWPNVNNRKEWQGTAFMLSLDKDWPHIWLGDNGAVIATNEKDYDPNNDETQEQNTWQNISGDYGTGIDDAGADIGEDNDNDGVEGNVFEDAYNE